MREERESLLDFRFFLFGFSVMIERNVGKCGRRRRDLFYLLGNVEFWFFLIYIFY